MDELKPTLEDEETQNFIDMCYKIGMKNGWCSGRYAMDDGDFIVEEDRLNKNSFTVFTDLNKLKEDMSHRNWCLGQAFVYHDLCFMNQVDGGGEWLTIKRFNDEAISFESISMHLVIEDGEFEDLIERLEKATKEQCQTLDY